jgi:hypothetical protein
MSFFVNRFMGVAMAAALMGVAATSALAQQRAEFHLPFQAKWAGTVLPPGDYWVSMPERSLGRLTFLVRGPAGSSFILPMTAGVGMESSDGDYLQLVKVDGEYFVKKYEQGSSAVTFFFKTPQPNRRLQMTSDNFVKIPVSAE